MRSVARKSILTVIVFLACGLPAAAQDGWPSLVIRAGGLIADVASQIRVNTSLGELGTDIDLEDDLGFASNESVAFVEGAWRISRRNQLQADYVNIHREVANVRPGRTITFRDTTYTVNSTIDSFLDTWYLSVNYGFAFIANPKAEVGVTIGATLMRINTGIGLSVGNNDDVSRDLADNAEFSAPIPLPGVFTNLRPHPRVGLDGSFRLIGASIDKFDGLMWQAKFGGDVTLIPHLALGAAYYFNNSHLDRDGRAFDGRIEYDFQGPQVYGSVSF
jgi:hypothetical protein